MREYVTDLLWQSGNASKANEVADKADEIYGRLLANRDNELRKQVEKWRSRCWLDSDGARRCADDLEQILSQPVKDSASD